MAISVDTAGLVEQFIRQGKYLKSWRPKTIASYRWGLERLKVELGEAPISEAILRGVVIKWREGGMSTGTCNHLIRTVNSFLGWLYSERLIPEAWRLQLLKTPRTVPRLFTALEVRKLLLRRPIAMRAVRAWALVTLMVDTGARIEEALSLKVHDLDLDNLLVKLDGKGGHERVVPISIDGRKILFQWTQVRERAKYSGPYLFAAGTEGRMSYRNAYRDIKVHAAQAGVEGAHVHPHAFRHFFAVSYLKNGGDLYTLSRILGHTTVTTTQIYLRSLGVEELAVVHRRAGPLARWGLGVGPSGEGGA